MTYDEAIAIRTRQLAGESVAPGLLDDALAAIRSGRPKAPPSLPEQMLSMLLSGPVEREEFWRTANELYAATGRKAGPLQRLAQMQDEGLMRVEVHLTVKGRIWLESRK